MADPPTAIANSDEVDTELQRLSHDIQMFTEEMALRGFIPDPVALGDLDSFIDPIEEQVSVSN